MVRIYSTFSLSESERPGGWRYMDIYSSKIESGASTRYRPNTRHCAQDVANVSVGAARVVGTGGYSVQPASSTAARAQG